MRIIAKEELVEILRKHALWLNNDPEGERADLYRAELYGANLREADLRGADLYGANLREADLRGAELYGANLREADLYGADLRGADLYGANLYGAYLTGAENLNLPIACPEEGSFIGFKKCRNELIVKLEIPADALRCSATGKNVGAPRPRCFLSLMPSKTRNPR